MRFPGEYLQQYNIIGTPHNITALTKQQTNKDTLNYHHP